LDRATFPLADLHPGWRGHRLCELRETLDRGLARLRRELADRPIGVCALLSEYDIDGLSETITQIAGTPDTTIAGHLANGLCDATAASFLARPGWRVLADEARPRSFAGENFPPHLAALKLGDGGGSNAAYVRIWGIARADGADTLGTLFDALPLEEEFVRYLEAVGAGA
jgi:hypothetical protein